MVSEYLPDSEPFELVDVGAGAGLLGTFLARDRPLVSYRFVEPIASLRAVLTSRYGSAADAGGDRIYRAARFVTLLDVLEHQEDDRRFMAELLDKMPSGASLLLTVPAGQELWSQWDVSLGHHRRYSRDSLVECFDGLPVHIREVSYLFPELVPLALLRARRLRRVRQPLTVPPGPGVVSPEPDPEYPPDDAAAFPELPGPVDDVLTALGRGSAALRRRWRTGTSLFLAATISRETPDGPS